MIKLPGERTWKSHDKFEPFGDRLFVYELDEGKFYFSLGDYEHGAVFDTPRGAAEAGEEFIRQLKESLEKVIPSKDTAVVNMVKLQAGRLAEAKKSVKSRWYDIPLEVRDEINRMLRMLGLEQG